MIADNDYPATNGTMPYCLAQGTFQIFKLMVYHDPQSLEGARCRV
jgi:hypothetical protein